MRGNSYRHEENRFIFELDCMVHGTDTEFILCGLLFSINVSKGIREVDGVESLCDNRET